MSEESANIKTSWDGHYMYPAYVGFLHFALGNDEILGNFRSETGNTWMPGKTPIDRMIDKAVGADVKFFQEFSDWCERTLYGTPADLDSKTPL